MNGNKKIILETEQDLGGGVVRSVAMDTTDGLSRGMEVVNTGAPISVPVRAVYNDCCKAVDSGQPIINLFGRKRHFPTDFDVGPDGVGDITHRVFMFGIGN